MKIKKTDKDYYDQCANTKCTGTFRDEQYKNKECPCLGFYPHKNDLQQDCKGETEKVLPIDDDGMVILNQKDTTNENNT